MSKVCDSCGKRPQMGHSVSHSNIKTLRRFNPNIVKKKFFDEKSGKSVVRKLCTACMRTIARGSTKQVRKPRTTKKVAAVAA